MNYREIASSVSVAVVPDETGHGGEWVPIGPIPSERTLREFELVLRAKSVRHRPHRDDLGFYVLVPRDQAGTAKRELGEYIRENAEFPPRRAPREVAKYVGFSAVIAMLLVFCVGVWWLGPAANNSSPVFREGASVAYLLRSEPFRATTALSLHADAPHALSNLVSGAIFGRALERRVGPALGAWSFVAAGTVGNLLNGFFYQSLSVPHSSIGASTGVFGLIGVLAMTEVFRPHSPEGVLNRRYARWISPLLAGLTLLGVLGSAPQTDILAHAFGLLAGFVLGVPVALGVRGRGTLPRWFNIAGTASVPAAFALAWSIALARP